MSQEVSTDQLLSPSTPQELLGLLHASGLDDAALEASVRHLVPGSVGTAAEIPDVGLAA
ncbi:MULTISPECIES: hypothetical protein [unclassified Streptomyces]|uniref:hypothetical protein n=1 Tax=unclassified Streptomyces TaxID=2593676 RepID=UPI002E2D3FFA|nr:hypothetical protein [Streptomyces sp. NBC_00273]